MKCNGHVLPLQVERIRGASWWTCVLNFVVIQIGNYVTICSGSQFSSPHEESAMTTLDVRGTLLLTIFFCASGGDASAQVSPGATTPLSRIVKEWQLEGFHQIAATNGEGMITREYRSEKSIASLFDEYAVKIGSIRRYTPGAWGTETKINDSKLIDFRHYTAMSADNEEDKELVPRRSRQGVQSATLCVGTESATTVIVLSRGKAESVTFVSMVVIAK